MPGKLLPDNKIERLWRRGLGPAEIVRVLLEEDNIEVTPAAISMWRHRRGIDPMRDRYDDLIPWRVDSRHLNSWPAKMLRALARQRRGTALRPRQEQDLERWLARLREQNVVVHYEADTERGWYYVPPREGVDLDVIRDPRLDDNGNTRSKHGK